MSRKTRRENRESYARNERGITDAWRRAHREYRRDSDDDSQPVSSTYMRAEQRWLRLRRYVKHTSTKE